MSVRKYQPLTIPKLEWDTATLTKTYGRLVAQPFEAGFGITFGNALRRILLGGIEGSAVTSVIISGINNEFSAIPGVEEDGLQVILNCKELVVASATGEPGVLTATVKGPGVLTGADLQGDKHLEVINKDKVIANVADGATLTMQFFVENGRGYRPAQWPVGKVLQEDNRIYLDASFSPVKKVTYDVEKTRVGGSIDYDRLILEVTTDGSMSPTEAVHYAVSVIRSQFEHFLIDPEVPFNEISHVVQPVDIASKKTAKKTHIKDVPIEFLLKPIEALDLSVRAHNCLTGVGINTILELVNMQEDYVMKIKNFGRKSFEEVCDKMQKNNLSFDMNISSEDIERAQEESL